MEPTDPSSVFRAGKFLFQIFRRFFGMASPVSARSAFGPVRLLPCLAIFAGFLGSFLATGCTPLTGNAPIGHVPPASASAPAPQPLPTAPVRSHAASFKDSGETYMPNTGPEPIDVMSPEIRAALLPPAPQPRPLAPPPPQPPQVRAEPLPAPPQPPNDQTAAPAEPPPPPPSETPTPQPTSVKKEDTETGTTLELKKQEQQ